MNDFFTGFSSSLAATAAVAAFVRYGWPALKHRFNDGIDVSGGWDIFEERDGVESKVGLLDIKQIGFRITATSTRTKRRDGEDSTRRFNYNGVIRNNQITLVFDDQRGKGFDTGSYVFTVQNDGVTMEGIATFHGKPENKVIAEARSLRKRP